MAKAVEPRVPLWAFLIGAQLVDVFWAVFVLVGAEHVRIDSQLPSNPLDLYHMPYTHSLVGTGVWACAAALLVARTPGLGGTRRAGVAMGLVVASHWFLDLLVHRPDLTLWGGAPKLGLGLWNVPLLAYALELALVGRGAAFYALRCGLTSRGLTLLCILVGLLILLQTAVVLGRPPSSVPALALAILTVFMLVAYAGLRTERWAGKTAA